MKKRTRWLAGCAGVLIAVATGCGPNPKPEDLGEVTFNGLDVPGVGERYEMPELDKAQALADAEAKADKEAKAQAEGGEDRPGMPGFPDFPGLPGMQAPAQGPIVPLNQ